ncbi:MAG: hypothetical protein ACXWWT_11475 [Candidatus Deferrimicrobiaceae bacterium]
MERRPRDELLGKKGVAALLVALYSTVVFSASPEWVAWQGPLVVGVLDVQTTDSGYPPLGNEPWARAEPGRCPPPSGAAPGESDKRGGPVAGKDASRTASGPVRPDPPGLRPRGADVPAERIDPPGDRG